MARAAMKLPGAGDGNKRPVTIGLANGAREFQCPLCKQTMETNNHAGCRCGNWKVRWIQKPQSGGWGAGEMISVREMILKQNGK
jgi:hypothetical protein